MGKNGKNIKIPEFTQSSGGVGVTQSQYNNSGDLGTPVFCFKNLHQNFNLTNCCQSDKSFPKGLLKKLEAISKNSWNQIQLAPRKGIGTEKIARNSIKVSVPNSISPDVKDFLSFYFAGTKGRLIGYRGEDTVFHVVYIDTKLKVYSH